MSLTDLIGDQLTVIRNATMAGKKNVTVKKSGMFVGILEIIKKEGFIDDFKVIDDNQQGKVKVYLKQLKGGVKGIEGIKRISTPGRRQYIAADEVKKVMGGVGVAILSTNKGLLTDEEAKIQGVGGELICEIW
jgi:small subunit ribosomal protein S8